MSALRQQALELQQIDKSKRLEEKRIAFEELKNFSKSVPDLDEDKALSEYMEEKFGNVC